MNDSLFHINTDSISTRINSSPMIFFGSQFTQLPNGDWLVCGGCKTVSRTNDEYLLFKQGPNQWTKLGTMKRERWHHSSVYVDGVLLTTGGSNSTHNALAHHEHFSFDGGVKDRKELPIALRRHRATMFGNNKMLISGGCDIQVSKPHNESYR